MNTLSKAFVATLTVITIAASLIAAAEARGRRVAHETSPPNVSLRRPGDDFSKVLNAEPTKTPAPRALTVELTNSSISPAEHGH
jgi:hypothetical protein